MIRKIVPSSLPDIESRFRDGESMEAIGRHYGVTRERIRQLLGKLGVKSGDGGFAVQQARAARVLAQMYDQGLSLREIASRAGRNAITVSAMLAAEGRSDWRRGLPPMHPRRCELRAREAIIVAQYVSGRRVRDIMNDLGIGSPQVIVALSRAGVPQRRPGCIRRPRHSAPHAQSEAAA